jgi:hypothetical protein
VIERRQEYAANLLLEDSSLRGRLTDEQFQPLLDWALTWSDAYAAATLGLEAWKLPVEVGVGWVKANVRALVALVESWPDRPPVARAQALSALAPSFPAPGLAAAAARLARLRDPASAIAEQLPVGPK